MPEVKHIRTEKEDCNVDKLWQDITPLLDVVNKFVVYREADTTNTAEIRMKAAQSQVITIADYRLVGH